MEYLDFEVSIDRVNEAEYRVTVVDSPAGQTSETARFPFDQEQLKDRLGGLRETLVRSRGTRDVAATVGGAALGQKAAQDFGGALFELLFPGDVRNLFVQSLRHAEEKPDRGLRIRFRTMAPELAVLPWELLYDRRPGSFVCLSNATPFVRFLPTQQPAEALAVPPPLRILGMIANPPGLAMLDVQGEVTRLEDALGETRRRNLLHLTWIQGGSWQALKDALSRGNGPWHVFHFIGHGDFEAGQEGHLALTTEQGERYDLSAMSLGNLLADHRSLRLVVLNACKGAKGSGTDLFSSTAATLVRRGLPAVVSMQQEISDAAALEFSKEFYGGLASGHPVDNAVAEARKCISLALPRSIE
jgi:CHAT domain